MKSSEAAAKTVVVKIGTSSLTDGSHALLRDAIVKLCDEIAILRDAGHKIVLVSSAAIAAGMAKLQITDRPKDFGSLQALSAVGQIELMRHYDEVCASHGFACGQVLLAPPDFFDRSRYLRARTCIERQLAMDVLPVINENDAVADDAIRFGDNDRIAALVAHLVHADLLVLLTDTAGLLTSDPRVDANAALIEHVDAIDTDHEDMAKGAATEMSQGGMASKLSAAKIASWSGVETIIAAAHRENVLSDAVAGKPGVGTRVQSRPERLGARKLWIAFALSPLGRITVDPGAQQALVNGGASLLAVGITSVEGDFLAGDAVEVANPDGEIFAKGLARHSSTELASSIGERSVEVIHRDHFAMLPQQLRS